jgi:prephenate dehydrogenase
MGEVGTTAEPPFQSIAIVGLGLIGGSIALAVRERWPASRLVGVDTAAVLAHAMGSGAIDRTVASVAALPAVDLVILAAPVNQNIELLKQLAQRAEPAVITDVGGTKRAIVDAARTLPASSTFVGGHPLGGAERGGFGFARPDLFAGRPWIFTPSGNGADASVTRLSELVSGFGAAPTIMDADQHDRVMAFVSHLPQLTASALMEVVGRATAAGGVRLGGRGLVDTTRLASSPANVWRDICATNADAIGDALDLLIACLSEMRSNLQRGDTIDAIFDEAGRWRAELMKGRE